ncbi:MAG: hypothetical protein ACAH27_00415 [Xanthobacteraceae bacterium]
MGPETIDIAIVGAHLSGMPLNHELTALRARFLRAELTAPAYRLFELPDTTPSKPGLLRVGSGGGSISLELWTLEPAAFGRFVARVPSPLSIGTVLLAGGGQPKGFLVEAAAVERARDITAFGGWRQFREGLQSATQFS